MHRRLSYPYQYLNALIFLVFCAQAAIIAQEPIKIGKISGTVTFDGQPDEEAWNQASLFPMIVHAPNYGTEPSERSEIMIGYDQEYLWIGARLIPGREMISTWF